MRRFIFPFVILAIAALALTAVAADHGPHQGSLPAPAIDNSKSPALAPQDGADLDVSVELLPGPGAAGDYTKTVSIDIYNGGDAAAYATVNVSLEGFSTPVQVTNYVYIAAGGDAVRNLVFPTMVPLPPGDYSICVEATAGSSTSSDCATYTVN